MSEPDRHAGGDVSPWVARFAHLVAPGGVVLDVACGAGRNARYFLARGNKVAMVDRDVSGVADLSRRADCEIVAADLEAGGGWPFAGGDFAAVVVTNYLYRPVFPALLAAVAPGGALIYETFARGNERFGRPRNPDFLLARGELLERVRGHLVVVAFEEGFVARPRPAVIQRICAVRPATELEALRSLSAAEPVPED